MAKGYPDFFGFSIFPQYGSFQFDVINVNVPNLVNTELVAVAGKGVTHSGIIEVSGTDLSLTDYFTVVVDSTLIQYVDIEDIFPGGFTTVKDYPMTCSYWRYSDEKYKFKINSGITFRDSFAIWMVQVSGAAATVAGWLSWYKLV